MQDQKLENLLNLALDASPEDFEQSQSLQTGYNFIQKTWELIVRYSGDLSSLDALGIKREELLNGYAILTAPEDQVEAVSSLPQIEYVEKPKRLFFSLNQGKSASCLGAVQTGGPGRPAFYSGLLNLTGKGVIVAVIDSGIDYLHPDFINPDGTTRILELWDQDLNRIFSEEEINEALEAYRISGREAARAIVPSADLSGHGTAVAGIAAGNGRAGDGQYRGVAYESSLLIVKLGTPAREGFPRTTELMRALNYVVKKGVELSAPIVINLSFGNTYGSHDGTSLLETFLSDISGYGKTTVVVGTGNEGSSGGHTSGQVEPGGQTEMELSVAPYETGMGLQLWKNYADIFTINLVTPNGEESGPINSRLGPHTLTYRDTRVLLYYGKPSPFSTAQEIYFDFLPQREYLDSGIWRIRLTAEKVVTGRYDLWLPSRNILNPSTRFLYEDPDITLTIPSTAARVITVGAYDASYQAYADFSGRGFNRNGLIKPDLAAPGVGIMAPSRQGGYEPVTGTSFATPFVSGSAALLAQWGVVEGEDPFLYGEKIKAFLIRGARQLPGYDVWPNPQLGWGALCVGDSLPV